MSRSASDPCNQQVQCRQQTDVVGHLRIAAEHHQGHGNPDAQTQGNGRSESLLQRTGLKGGIGAANNPIDANSGQRQPGRTDKERWIRILHEHDSGERIGYRTHPSPHGCCPEDAGETIGGRCRQQHVSDEVQVVGVTER